MGPLCLISSPIIGFLPRKVVAKIQCSVAYTALYTQLDNFYLKPLLSLSWHLLTFRPLFLSLDPVGHCLITRSKQGDPDGIGKQDIGKQESSEGLTVKKKLSQPNVYTTWWPHVTPFWLSPLITNVCQSTKVAWRKLRGTSQDWF